MARTKLPRKHFAGLVLIEVIVEVFDESFKIGDFSQDWPTGEAGYAQVAYEEAELTLDGEKLLASGFDVKPKAPGPVRLTYYLHFYDPTRPLRWSYGEFMAPPISPAPVRLSLLVPYCACS